MSATTETTPTAYIAFDELSCYAAETTYEAAAASARREILDYGVSGDAAAADKAMENVTVCEVRLLPTSAGAEDQGEIVFIGDIIFDGTTYAAAVEI